MIGSLNVGMVCTNHTYASQDMFDPDDKISGGSRLYLCIKYCCCNEKDKLKEDADGNKDQSSMWYQSCCKVMKTRYAKPFEGVQVKIPYSTGMNPYSGLLELFEAKDIIKKQGNRLAYTTLDGEEILDYRKKWIGENLDKVMSDYLVKEATVVNTENLEDDDLDIDIVEDNLELTEE